MPHLLAAGLADLLWIWEGNKMDTRCYVQARQNFAKHGLGEQVEKGGSVQVVVIKLSELLRVRILSGAAVVPSRGMSVL